MNINLIIVIILSLIIVSLSYRSNVVFKNRFITKLCMSDATPAAAPVSSELKVKLNTDMKEAMKAKDKERLAGIRAISTAIKQKEVDERVVVDDEMAVAIMAKLVKQRKESIKSYLDAGRQDLVDNEQKELDVIIKYMPAQLSSEEVSKMIDAAILEVNATTIKDMGKVMAILRPKLAGKADVSEAGDMIKQKLSGK